MKLTSKKLSTTEENTFYVEITLEEINDLLGACNAAELHCEQINAPHSLKAYMNLWMELYDIKQRMKAAK